MRKVGRRVPALMAAAAAVAVGSIAVSASSGSDAEAIVGGVGVEPWIYPQYVRMTHPSACGATVIATDTLLTAAHCVDGGAAPSAVRVFVGDVHLRTAQSIVIHPLWNGSEPDGHDLAVLRLVPGSTTGVTPIQVGSPWNAYYLGAGVPAAIVGHGATHAGYPTSPELRALDTVLRSDEEMDDIYNPFFGPDHWNEDLMIGAGTLDHTVCDGDSGGPLVVDKDGQWTWIQVGVASFVETWPTNCRQPGGFVQLSDAQLAWIAEQAPSITSRWGTCITPGGRVGVSHARYVSWFLPGGHPEGPYWWEITCRDAPPPPPPPPPGPPGTEPPPPPTTEPRDPPVCRLPPWKCPDI